MLNKIALLLHFCGCSTKKFALKNLFGIFHQFCSCKGVLMMRLIGVLAVLMVFSLTIEAKTIVIEEIKIEGTIQKPEVMTFLSRAKFSDRSLNLNISFLEEVEKAVQGDETF